MKLVVSSIAWTNEEEDGVADLLKRLKVKYVEVAPTKIWDDPTHASEKAINDYKEYWRKKGIKIVAFQSMLFSRPDLKIFENEINRQETLKYLQDFIRLAGKMGVTRMVFGSPKNRQTNGLNANLVATIARDFFDQLGSVAQDNGVCFCIEPNPTEYSCDFITNSSQGLDFVKRVNNRGFGLHLDIAGMTLAREEIAPSIIAAKDVLKHFHISSPFLEQVEKREDVHHIEAARALRDINYRGYVSIEMRPGEVGKNVSRVEKAIRFAQNIYE